MISNIPIEDQQELDELIAENEKVYHSSYYNFLNTYGGYLKGKIHLAIGPASGGKSTLTRSLIVDFLCNLKENEFIHVHLSEESIEEFVVEIGRTGIVFDRLKKIYFTSEQDDLSLDAGSVLGKIQDSLNRVEIVGLFFDNLTTSVGYMDRGVEKQGEFIKKLKSIIKSSNVPGVLIAHTGGDSLMTSTRLLEMNDIRGSKSTTNLAEFMYILQPIFIGDERYSILRIVKHRGKNADQVYFNLTYSHKARIFVNDTKIDFEKIKGYFNKRNKL